MSQPYDKQIFWVDSAMCSFHNKEARDALWIKGKKGYISICKDCLIRLVVEEHAKRYPERNISGDNDK